METLGEWRTFFFLMRPAPETLNEKRISNARRFGSDANVKGNSRLELIGSKGKGRKLLVFWRKKRKWYDDSLNLLTQAEIKREFSGRRRRWVWEEESNNV